MTSLAGSLPKMEQANGIGRVVPEMLGEPRRVHVVVALVDCKSTKIDHDTGELAPTIRVKRIEAILGDDLAIAQRLLERAYGQRCGQEPLPYELELDVRSAFLDGEQ